MTTSGVSHTQVKLPPLAIVSKWELVKVSGLRYLTRSISIEMMSIVQIVFLTAEKSLESWTASSAAQVAAPPR